jgi:hypothetical protein
MSHMHTSAKKIVLECPHGYDERLDAMVHQWIAAGVTFVAVVGEDCARVEDIIDELCVGDASNPYSMLTSSHPGESLMEVVEFAEHLSDEYAGPVEVVRL